MSTLESDGWQVEETITLISILKSLKESNGAGTMRKLDWPQVANQMAQSGGNRSIFELRERYKTLRMDYLAANTHNRSCQYYNYLNDLLADELLQQEQAEEQEEEDYEAEEQEQKYAHTLDYNGEPTNRCLDSAGKAPLRCRWAEGEVDAFLSMITTLKLQTPLLRKRNAKVFKLLSREMAKRHFAKRPDQLRVKYHQLRRQYAKAHNGGESFEHFEQMHALLNGALQQAESSDAELESDSNESVEEEGDAAAAGLDSESESALISAAIPSNVRVKWAEGEVDVFLDIIKSMGLQAALLRKRNAKIFKLLSKEMSKRSFDKAPEKLRIKFQHLRRQYNKAKAGGETFEHFEAMHQLLNPAKKSNADAELNFSTGSESDCIYSDEDETEAAQRNRPPDSYYWTDAEVDAFLAIIKQQNLFRALDGSKKRNFKTLAYISSLLAKQSYQRTPHQLRNKLRLLLRRYREVKKDGLKNVRMLPRHFDMFDDLMQKKRTTAKTKPDGHKSLLKVTPTKSEQAGLESDSEASSSGFSCDLLRAAGESEDFEDTFELAVEPTPLEVLASISEGQKQLLATLTDSHERFLRQQRDMQTQFLQQMSNIMRQEREATFRMLRELIQPK